MRNEVFIQVFLVFVSILCTLACLLILLSQGWFGAHAMCRYQVIRSDVLYHLIEFTCRAPPIDEEDGSQLIFSKDQLHLSELASDTSCWEVERTLSSPSSLSFKATISAMPVDSSAQQFCSAPSEFCDPSLSPFVSELQLELLTVDRHRLGPLHFSLAALSGPSSRSISLSPLPASAAFVQLRLCAYSRTSASPNFSPTLVVATDLQLLALGHASPSKVGPPLLRKAPLILRSRRNASHAESVIAWETSQPYHRDPRAQIQWSSGSSTHRVPVEQWEVQQISPCHFLYRARLSVPLSDDPPPVSLRWPLLSSDTYRWHPAPSRRVLIVSDSQYGAPVFRGFLHALVARSSSLPDCIMSLGDFVNNPNKLDEWDRYFWSPLELLHPRLVPLALARGNHDGEHPLSYAYTGAGHLARRSGGHMSDEDHWFHHDVAHARIFVLNSNLHPAAVPRQLEWLRRQLAEAVCDPGILWRVVAFHIPPFTDLWEHPGVIGERHIREHFIPIFQEYEVSVVLSGHTHAYLRGYIEGIHYLILGGAGGNLDVDRRYNWGIFSHIISTFHVAELSVSSSELSIDIFDRTWSQPLDSLSIPSPSPPTISNRLNHFHCKIEINYDKF